MTTRNATFVVIGGTRTGVGKGSLLAGLALGLQVQGTHVAVIDADHQQPLHVKHLLQHHQPQTVYSDLAELLPLAADRFKRTFCLSRTDQLSYFPCVKQRPLRALFNEVAVRDLLLQMVHAFDIVLINLPAGADVFPLELPPLSAGTRQSAPLAHQILVTTTDISSLAVVDQLLRTRPVVAFRQQQRLSLVLNRLPRGIEDHDLADRQLGPAEVGEVFKLPVLARVPIIDGFRVAGVEAQQLVSRSTLVGQSFLGIVRTLTSWIIGQNPPVLPGFGEAMVPMADRRQLRRWEPVGLALAQQLAAWLCLPSTNIGVFFEQDGERVRLRLRLAGQARPAFPVNRRVPWPAVDVPVERALARDAGTARALGQVVPQHHEPVVRPESMGLMNRPIYAFPDDFAARTPFEIDADLAYRQAPPVDATTPVRLLEALGALAPPTLAAALGLDGTSTRRRPGLPAIEPPAEALAFHLFFPVFPAEFAMVVPCVPWERQRKYEVLPTARDWSWTREIRTAAAADVETRYLVHAPEPAATLPDLFARRWLLAVGPLALVLRAVSLRPIAATTERPASLTLRLLPRSPRLPFSGGDLPDAPAALSTRDRRVGVLPKVVRRLPMPHVLRRQRSGEPDVRRVFAATHARPERVELVGRAPGRPVSGLAVRRRPADLMAERPRRFAIGQGAAVAPALLVVFRTERGEHLAEALATSWQDARQLKHCWGDVLTVYFTDRPLPDRLTAPPAQFAYGFLTRLRDAAVEIAVPAWPVTGRPMHWGDERTPVARLIAAFVPTREREHGPLARLELPPRQNVSLVRRDVLQAFRELAYRPIVSCIRLLQDIFPLRSLPRRDPNLVGARRFAPDLALLPNRSEGTAPMPLLTVRLRTTPPRSLPPQRVDLVAAAAPGVAVRVPAVWWSTPLGFAPPRAMVFATLAAGGAGERRAGMGLVVGPRFRQWRGGGSPRVAPSGFARSDARAPQESWRPPFGYTPIESWFHTVGTSWVFLVTDDEWLCKVSPAQVLPLPPRLLRFATVALNFVWHHGEPLLRPPAYPLLSLSPERPRVMSSRLTLGGVRDRSGLHHEPPPAADRGLAALFERQAMVSVQVPRETARAGPLLTRQYPVARTQVTPRRPLALPRADVIQILFAHLREAGRMHFARVLAPPPANPLGWRKGSRFPLFRHGAMLLRTPSRPLFRAASSGIARPAGAPRHTSPEAVAGGPGRVRPARRVMPLKDIVVRDVLKMADHGMSRLAQLGTPEQHG